MLYQIVLASVIGGVLSLAGGLVLLWRRALAKRFSYYLVSFAAGGLLGAAFFELLPEALEGGGAGIFGYVLVGILLVLVFEKFLGWFHHHDHERHEEAEHTFSTQTILFGDAIHNFVDGIAIALGFAVSVEVGVATTFAVFLHEIPQEIGDFAVFIERGYARGRIIWYNLFTALATVVGAILTYFFLPFFSGPTLFYALAVAAGTFIYISTSDLIPELRERTAGGFGTLHIIAIVIGIAGVALVSAAFSG